MNLPAGFDYRAGFLDAREADGLLQRLHEALDWRQYEIQLFGRCVPQPRLTAWSSDPGVCYRYSGLTLTPEPWHPALDELRHRLGTQLGHRFNSVLANAYRDGSDAMGWHADDEPELGPNPVIASVSLGQERRLRLRRTGGGESAEILLGHGSLLVMDGRSQHDWQHAIPRSRAAMSLRINLTFRVIRG